MGIKQKNLTRFVLDFFGAQNGTRTHTTFVIRPSNVRVYQFHHLSIYQLLSTKVWKHFSSWQEKNFFFLIFIWVKIFPISELKVCWLLCIKGSVIVQLDCAKKMLFFRIALNYYKLSYWISEKGLQWRILQPKPFR